MFNFTISERAESALLAWMHCATGLSLFFSVPAVYCLVYKTPKLSRPFRTYLLYLQARSAPSLRKKNNFFLT